MQNVGPGGRGCTRLLPKTLESCLKLSHPVLYVDVGAGCKPESNGWVFLAKSNFVLNFN